MSKFWKTIPAVVPIVLVNAVSVIGQVMFWRDHLPWPFIACLGFAIALESIAVYLAYHASLAERSQDSAYKLRLASYAFGLTIGILNGSHFLNHGQLTAASIGMGLLSASSPCLWSIQSRRASRDDLKAKGLIDDRSVRLGLRWIFFPRASFSVFRLAVWNGENNPELAIRNYEHAEAAKREVAEAIENQKRLELESREQTVERERKQIESERINAENEARERETAIHNALESASSQAERIRVALRYADATVPSDVIAWLAERGYNGITPANVRTVKNRERNTDANAVVSETNDANDSREGLHAV